MAVQTVDDFLAILEKSRLVSASGLQQIRKATAESADAKAVARFLIQRGILTRFQATQLLAGRHALQLGPYQLRDRIVSGGTGAVYAAQSAETKQFVTLKVLPGKLLTQEGVAGQLKQQAAKSKSLEHPHLCRATQLGKEGEQYYLIMEAAEGQGLRQRVEADGPLPFDTAAKMIQQAAAALSAAHAGGVVHGDITPDHLVCGDDDRIKLVDVGTAGLNPAAASADYAAPEVGGESPPTPASDVYSLGGTLYFLLTGKPPFPEGTAEEKRAKHRQELPASVLELRPDAPPELMKLTIRMMAKEPDKRIESAAAVVAGIDAWLATQTESAGSGEAAGQDDESLTDASDEDATDPDVDRALAEAMAAANFDDELYEPPPEAGAAAAAGAGSSAAAGAVEDAGSADDLLAEALAASEFDHEIEDDEKADKRKKRLGGVTGTNDDAFNDIPLQKEEEEPEESEPEEEQPAGGTKIFGLDVSKLLGTGGDPDDPAAKKEKLIVTAAAGGLIAVVVILLVWMYILPMFFGDDRPKRRPSGPPVAVNDPPTPPDGTDTPTPEDGTDTDPDGTDPDGTDPDGTDPDGTEPTDGTETPPENGTETPPTDGTETPPTGGTGTPPEDGTPEDPGGAPTDPVTPPANPFAALATSVDLPDLSSSDLLTLGPVDAAAEAECTATLIGSEVGAVAGASFTMQDMGVSEKGHAWIVSMTVDGAEPKTVGQFLLKEGELAFQWARGMETNEDARALRQLGLKMQSGANAHVLALKTPFFADPIVADFQRGVMRALFDLGWTGDQEALMVEITSFEGEFPAHEFKGDKRTMKAAGDSAFVFFGDGDDKTLALKAEVSLTPKLQLVLSPIFKVKTEAKSLPFNASNAQRVGTGIARDLQDKKESLEALQTREKETSSASEAERLRTAIAKREAEVADLELAFNQMKKLSEFAIAVHDKGKIHYRVYYQVGDDQVDLARTEEPAADEPTP